MKTHTTIITIALIIAGHFTFSSVQRTSLDAYISGEPSSQKEIYVSINGDIYKINNVDNNDSPVKININTKYEESNPVLSPDGNTLYFVSDRKGGFGGKDIWASERLSDGSWCKPCNLGPQINTCKDEDNPIILDDGVTLTFTTSGRNESNENEIYSATMNDEGLWTLPEKFE